MDKEHTEAAAAEEPPQLTNRGLDEDSDSDNEDDNTAPEFKVVPTATPPGPPAGVPVVLQDDDVADTPTANTRARSKLRTLQDEANVNLEATMVLIEAASTRCRAPLLQEVMATRLHIVGATMEVSTSKAATRRSPLQFLCDLTNAVLDGDAGEMLKYRHLITRPKYKVVWGDAYGKEIGRLAQGIPGHVDGTNTMFFVNKSEVSADRFKDVTRDRIVCNVHPEKDDPNRFAPQPWVISSTIQATTAHPQQICLQ